MEVPRLA
jgi:hypothetical protein